VKDGGYRLNASKFTKYEEEKMVRFEDGTIGKPFFTRRKVLSILLLLVLVASVGATVSAMFNRAPPSPPPAQEYVDTFTMKLKVLNAIDVWAYQVVIYYNPLELDVLEVVEGDFLGKSYPAGSTVFMSFDDIGPGKLLIGGTLLGDEAPVSGTGVLATVTFGVKSEGTPQLPYIAYNDNLFVTVLRNPENQNTTGSLTLEMEG
jgi:hypothetical protein